MNCSTKITKEHFISNALLQKLALNGQVKVAGFRWQSPEVFDLIPLKGLASNVLCDRHNNALHPLDDAADELARSIHAIDQSPGTAAPVTTASGSDFERWIIKCVMGASASGNLKSSIKPECLDLLFAKRPWPDGWGLNFSTFAAVFQTDSFAFNRRVGPDNTVLDADVYLQGLPFTLCLGVPDHPEAFGIFRPKGLAFRLSWGEKRIEFDWDDHHSREVGVFLDRIGTYSGNPPSWPEWERDG